MRRQGASQTMPTGKIKHLIYEEYGSSRPNPVYYEIKVESSTGKVMLYGPENRRLDEAEKRPQITLSEDVLNTIRQMRNTKSIRNLPIFTVPFLQVFHQLQAVLHHGVSHASWKAAR